MGQVKEKVMNLNSSERKMSNKVITIKPHSISDDFVIFTEIKAREKYIPLINNLIQILQNSCRESQQVFTIDSIFKAYEIDPKFREKYGDSAGLCFSNGKITTILIIPSIFWNFTMHTFCHEVAHCILQHGIIAEPTPDEAMQNEIQADLWALNMMGAYNFSVSKYTKHVFGKNKSFKKAHEIYKRNRKANNKVKDIKGRYWRGN